MSINFGNTNTTRYFSGAVNQALTQSNTFLAVLSPTQISTENPKYAFSSGSFEGANSAAGFVAGGSDTWGYALGGNNIQVETPPVTIGNWLLVYGRRIVNTIHTGFIDLSTTLHHQSGPQTRSNAVTLSGDLYIGSRSDLTSTRFWQGYISWFAIVNDGLTNQQLIDLAAGDIKLFDDLYSILVDVWDFSADAATITGAKSGSRVLTRQGTGYGTPGPDPLPYKGTPVAVSWSGSISNQQGTVGTPFNLDLKPSVSGNILPITYSIQAGTLPSGIGLSDGVITGTPGTQETRTGIVIRATDNASNTADTNAFDFEILPELAIVKGVNITLNVRSTLQPQGTITGCVVRWWDGMIEAGAPLYIDTNATITAGVLTIDLDSITSLPLNGLGYLVVSKQNGTPEEDLHFAGRVPIVDIAT